MSNTTAHAVIDAVTAAARVCRVGAGFPTAPGGAFQGQVIFWASEVTEGNGADLLRCLAALGLSRSPMREVQTPSGAMRRADLSDLCGEVRGDVILLEDGSASATLWYALTRPLACIAA